MKKITTISLRQITDDLFCVRIWRSKDLVPQIYCVNENRAEIINDLAKIKVSKNPRAHIRPYMHKGKVSILFVF